jgi:hypothetical protein
MWLKSSFSTSQSNLASYLKKWRNKEWLSVRRIVMEKDSNVDTETISKMARAKSKSSKVLHAQRKILTKLE